MPFYIRSGIPDRFVSVQVDGGQVGGGHFDIVGPLGRNVNLNFATVFVSGDDIIQAPTVVGANNLNLTVGLDGAQVTVLPGGVLSTELVYLHKSQMLHSALAATRKSVTINIADDDLIAMKGAGYSLCFAKKIANADYNVVWQSLNQYLSETTFSWTPQYELFGSNVFSENVLVETQTNIVSIGLGEMAILDGSGLLHSPTAGGESVSITLDNKYGPIHPGIKQTSTVNGKTMSTPIYVAKDIVVLGQTKLTPVERVLVWFEQNVQTSTMFSQSRSLSIEIDLTNQDSQSYLYQAGKWGRN